MGIWRPGRFGWHGGSWTLPAGADTSVHEAIESWKRALPMLFRSIDARLAFEEIESAIGSRDLAVRFEDDGDTLLGADVATGHLIVAADAFRFAGLAAPSVPAGMITDPERQGFDQLFGLGLAYALLCHSGRSPQAALRRVLALYTSYSSVDRSRVLEALKTPGLDPGHLFRLFLQRATDAESGPERERHITWLLGQNRIDLPYDRLGTLRVLRTGGDADGKRRQLYHLVEAYDRTVERRNIERLSAEFRANRQALIFGRMSRAFHDQGLLFADAVLVQPAADWPGLADEISALSTSDGDTETAAAALRLLLSSPSAVPLIQLEGALERFEDAALEAQRRALAAALQAERLRVQDHNDEDFSPASPAVAPHAPALRLVEHRLQSASRLRASILEAERCPAAYVVISQRPSPTGSHLLVKLNEFDDPYAGKPENLRKLFRLAGDRIYASPDYGWLEVADHWIEAIPLFIKEAVHVENGQEVARTVVDIDGLEASFREEMAVLWARNIRRVMATEFLALARGILDESDGSGDEEAIRHRLIDENAHPEDIAAVGLLLTEAYRRHAGTVQKRVEMAGVAPFEAARDILSHCDPVAELSARRKTIGSWRGAVAEALEGLGWTGNLEHEIARLAPEALKPRRPQPALHVLTTQSAGMTEGYVQYWLEESMALCNIVHDLGLQDAVESTRQRHQRKLLALSTRLIQEFGLWVEIEELRASEALDEAEAIDRLLRRNREVRDAVSCLGTLLEFSSRQGALEAPGVVVEPACVRSILENEASLVRDSALDRVLERNGTVLREELAAYLCMNTGLAEREALARVVAEDEFYQRDLELFTRIAARRLALHRLDAEHPEWQLREQARTFLRRYRDLALTTARKEILAERGLNHLTLDPFYRFSATGGCKRYHLLYTPSRVDLGQRERESVESWTQWVGGADAAAVRAGRDLYQLINKDVRAFASLAEPEVLKTGENASMVAHFAFSNALSLMVSTTGLGDFESMADQMNRRRDRRVHPAGEGYGGYCVPKDGLFLEFVLSLDRAEKLTQIGLPPACHEAVVRLANSLLDRRSDFSSTSDWEAWAAAGMQHSDGLLSDPELKAAVFQATRVAEVFNGLGRPELRDAGKVASSLAARWGLHKMVTAGEQVNRFMPLFKCWLIRQALIDSALRDAGPAAVPKNSIVVLTAEYKPDTQDGRFSAGMRKFEILAAAGEHLLSALDGEGQDLALLLNYGYRELEHRGRCERIHRWLGLDPADEEGIAKLHRLFPVPEIPQEIRVVSPTGLSTQDLMGYTSDTRLTEIAEAARADLLAFGFSARDIEANLTSFGPRLHCWQHRLPVSPGEMDALRSRLGGRLHALSLAVRGPENDYIRALQGADVLDTGVPHTILLDLLADPGLICRLMLNGNPRSALAIVDGCSGARPRAMNRLDVMLWFAAAQRHGRDSVYLGIGLGRETVESWRAEMCRLRRNAERLLTALLGPFADEANGIYQEIVRELQQASAAREQLDEIDKLARGGRLRERDRAYAQSLTQVASGLALPALDFAGFLALGGIFLLTGAEQAEISACRSSFESGVARVGGRPDVSSAHWSSLLPVFEHSTQEGPREERGVEGSNKAVEESPSVALEARRQLSARLARARGLNERYAACAAVPRKNLDFAASFQNARKHLGTGERLIAECDFGAFIGHTRNALEALARAIGAEEHLPAFLLRAGELCGGRRIDPSVWQVIAGGYEDIGDFGRLAQAVTAQAERGEIDTAERQRRLGLIAMAGELFEILLAVDSMQDVVAARLDDPAPVWRALADFFAKTLNDHHYEYRPWLYSRGIGFSGLRGDELYALAAERHAWLYRYLRGIAVRYTDLRALPVEEQDGLLGNFLDGNTIEAIGAEADSPAECAWRAYGQIRELAFLRNDGFPLPEVFLAFDPQWIHDRSRVNHVIAAPVGRTHFSRMLREGPTLSRELEGEGGLGANLVIGRKLDFRDEPGSPRPVVCIRSGHLYLDAEAYRAALSRCKPDAQPSVVHPKGIRVAARFTHPMVAGLVYPFHGDPAYLSGALEQSGLPYTVQSLFHSWTTYDKAKYPAIFRDAGVELPAEIDWLAEWTAQADEATVKHRIRDGLPGTDYPGLAAFAARHPKLMVKDAAESGGRGMRAFRLQTADGDRDGTAWAEAVDFIYQISRQHNVVVQEMIHGSPEVWATEAFMAEFVRRQIIDWGHAVERRREPRTPIYGSLRVIVSTDCPMEPDPEKKWHLSHWITLNSRSSITNVGRGGTLEQLLPEYIRTEFRDRLMERLTQAARRAAEALSAYESRANEAYRRETGRVVGVDLTGVSYGKPRYLMLDFLIVPIFAEAGCLIDIRPAYGENGGQIGAQCVLQHGGRRFPGTVTDWRVVLIEPNIGVGLWDRVAIREEFHELQRAEREGGQPDWTRIGANARIVLRDLNRGGADYLRLI